MKSSPTALAEIGEGAGTVHERDWRSYHLVYHGDRDRLLLELLEPAVEGLWRQGCIGSFFYIRYALGGPHLRLRLRVHPGSGERVNAFLAGAAGDFFGRWPSTDPRTEKQIRRENEAILASDGSDREVPAYPDNTILPASFRFELERYGGPAFLPASLDFFALSSVQALLFLRQHAREPAARRLPRVIRLLARQALGFSAGFEEWAGLLEYAVRDWPLLTAIVARADLVYESRSAVFRQLLRVEVEEAAAGVGAVSPGTPAWELEGARRLARAVCDAPLVARRRIFESQLHMTANRLGVKNPEEVYLGRLMGRAAHDLRACGLVFPLPPRDGVAGGAVAAAGGRLRNLLPGAFAELRAAAGDRQDSPEREGEPKEMVPIR